MEYNIHRYSKFLRCGFIALKSLLSCWVTKENTFHWFLLEFSLMICMSKNGAPKHFWWECGYDSCLRVFVKENMGWNSEAEDPRWNSIYEVGRCEYCFSPDVGWNIWGVDDGSSDLKKMSVFRSALPFYWGIWTHELEWTMPWVLENVPSSELKWSRGLSMLTIWMEVSSWVWWFCGNIWIARLFPTRVSLGILNLVSCGHL